MSQLLDHRPLVLVERFAAKILEHPIRQSLGNGGTFCEVGVKSSLRKIVSECESVWSSTAKLEAARPRQPLRFSSAERFGDIVFPEEASESLELVPAGDLQPNTADEQPISLATLPTELRLEISRLVLEISSRKQLRDLMETCRSLFSVGLPWLLRELSFPVRRSRGQDCFMIFNRDLQKYRFVRQLTLLANSKSEFFLLLLQRCALYLEDLTLSVYNVEEQGERFWDQLECCDKLKKLAIVCRGNKTGARDYVGLLDVVEALDNLKEFGVRDTETGYARGQLLETGYCHGCQSCIVILNCAASWLKLPRCTRQLRTAQR
jgi:hypothetical protein